MAQGTISISKVAYDAQQEQTKKLLAKLAAYEKGETPTKIVVQQDPDVVARLAKLEEENRQLKANQAKMKMEQRGSLSFKVGEKGGLSIYGLGRFPFTPYKNQLLRIFDVKEQLRAFMEEHKAELKTKK